MYTVACLLCIRVELQIVKLASDVHEIGGVAAGFLRSSNMLSGYITRYPGKAVMSVEEGPNV